MLRKRDVPGFDNELLLPAEQKPLAHSRQDDMSFQLNAPAVLTDRRAYPAVAEIRT